MMSSMMVRAWILSLVLAAAAMWCSDAAWSAHDPIYIHLPVSRDTSSSSMAMVLHPVIARGLEESHIETLSEMLAGEAGVEAQLGCRASNAELVALSCPVGKTMLFSVRSATLLSQLFSRSPKQVCAPAGCVETSLTTGTEDAVEEALLTIAQAAFTSEPRRTFSAVLNGLADRHRKDSKRCLADLRKAMKKRDIPKMKSLVRTAAEDGYVRKIVEEADAVLQRFELEQELTAAARLALEEGTTSTLAAAVDLSNTISVDSTLLVQSLRVLHKVETIQATTEMRSCSAVRSLEAEDAAKALAAAEETCKAAKIRTAAVTESQAAGAKSHESELLRMIDSLKADVGSLSQEVVDAKREKIQEAIRSRDLQRSLDEERRHFSEVMAKQNTAPVADLAKLEDQVNDIEQQRRKLVSRIALEKKESSTSEKLKKDTHTAEQIEQQVDELTVRANDTLKQVKEQHAVRMAATQEVIKSAHEFHASNKLVLRFKAEMEELEAAKTAFTNYIAAAGRADSGVGDEREE